MPAVFATLAYKLMRPPGMLQVYMSCIDMRELDNDHRPISSDSTLPSGMVMGYCGVLGIFPNGPEDVL